MTTFAEKIVAVDRQLSEAKVDHAFGGAICLGYHIESPRATVDIDVNVSVEPRRARSVLAALPHGVAWGDADVRQIARDGQARVFWHGTPIDLFFPQHDLHGVVRSRVERVPFAGTSIPILSATDLAIFKALFDRPKDWVDIDAMVEYGEIDMAEVESWLVRLVGPGDRRVKRWQGLVGDEAGIQLH